VAGFHEWDALDPVDRIDLRVPRIAEPLDPLPHPPTPGILKFPVSTEKNSEFCRIRLSRGDFRAQSASKFSGLQLKFPS
jgi:hypothetical protein